MIKRKRIIIYTLIALLLCMNVSTNRSYASSSDKQTLILVGYFEYWQDPGGKWMFDDATGRNTMIGPTGQVKFYSTNINIPSGYKLIDIQQYDPNSTYENLKKLTQVPDDKISRNSVQHMVFSNKEDIIGAKGQATLEFGFYVEQNRALKYKKGGIDVYRLYLPWAFICEKIVPDQPEKEPTLTISGEVNPNPAKLSGGKADVRVTVNAKVSDLKEEIESWELAYENVKGEWIRKVYKNYKGDEVGFQFPSTEIFGDHRFKIQTTLKTKGEKGGKESKTFITPGETFVFTFEDGSDDHDSVLKARLKAEVKPKVLEITKKDLEENVRQEGVDLILDAYGSESSEGIKEYLFYYRVNKKRGWQYSEWITEDICTFPNIEIYPEDFGGKDTLEITGRVSIKDKRGKLAYSSDRVILKKEDVTKPPTTQLHLPNKFYPIEVTNSGKIKNKITWDYASKDDIPYKESVVSLYKFENDTWNPVFIDQKQEPRELVITGKKDEEYKICVKVVDELDKISEVVQEEFIIENADPIITLQLNTSRINENILGIMVENKTPTDIESIFPTKYTNWIIYNAYGDILEQGKGKAPDSIKIDSRYYGNVATVIQYAENILKNKAKAMDAYIDNSMINFEAIPYRLYETELCKLVDTSKAIKNQEWSISRILDNNFKSLKLDEQDQFTREYGKYSVRLDGDGKFAESKTKYQYSNDKALLRKDPIRPNDTAIHTEYGSMATYVYDSAHWCGNIQQGNFSDKGKSYKYKREYSFMILKTDRVDQTKTVEFLNTKPNAKFKVTGNLKMYKKVTLDGNESVNVTDQELQKKYPINFKDTRTRFVVEPLTKLNGSFDPSKNKYIKGTGRELVDGKVIFKGKAIQNMRFDIDGAYKISYKVYNGMKESDWVSQEIVVTPELLPTVDINVSEKVTHRDPSLGLKSALHVIVDYNSQDDEIDIEKCKLFISYDQNHDGDFTNDGVHSTQWIMKNSEELQGYLTVSRKDFQKNKALFSILVDNPEKNVLGSFKFEFEAVEKPIVPNYEIEGDMPTLSANTETMDDTKKITFIDNKKPVIHLDLSRGKRIELNYIDTIGNVSEKDIVEFFEEAELRGINLVRIKYISPDNKVILYEKKDGVLTHRQVLEK